MTPKQPHTIPHYKALYLAEQREVVRNGQKALILGLVIGLLLGFGLGWLVGRP